MHLPPFNYEKQEWDSWRAFHVAHKYRTFIQFDTGEFVVCNRRWAPEERKVYEELNIQIVGTDDDYCPPLYTPGMASKRVLKSHLNYKGQQILLLDLDRKRAVSLGHYLTDHNAPLVPARFTGSHNVVAWYAGPDAVPVGAPIVRHYPQPLTRAQREHIKELEDASKVWLQMQPEPDVLARAQRRTNTPTLKVIEFADVSFGALTSEHRTSIAVHGFDYIVKEEHPYLVFVEEEKA